MSISSHLQFAKTSPRPSNKATALPQRISNQLLRMTKLNRDANQQFAMRDPIKAYVVVKYTTTAFKPPQYTISLDTGTLPAHLSLAATTTAISLQFIAKHNSAITINVEAWSFEEATAQDTARKDYEYFWETAGGQSYRLLGKESNFAGAAMRYCIAVEDVERPVPTKKAWVFSMGNLKKGRVRKEDEGGPKERLWFWWDVVEIVED